MGVHGRLTASTKLYLMRATHLDQVIDQIGDNIKREYLITDIIRHRHLCQQWRMTPTGNAIQIAPIGQVKVDDFRGCKRLGAVTNAFKYQTIGLFWHAMQASFAKHTLDLSIKIIIATIWP